jgi:Ca-activated chloride channel family protein
MSRLSLSLLLLASPGTALTAQGWIETDRRPVDVRMPSALIRVESRVRAAVDGRIARFEVLERFRNTGAVIAEGTYLYPLPGEAAFSDFTLFQGEQALTGEMLDAEQARSIYEGIVRRLKDPALLTLVGHGLIRARIFPVQPGETRTVVLRYAQMLTRDGDALRLRYAAGERGEGAPTVTIDVRGDSLFATPYSPTHAIATDRRSGDLRVTVGQPVRGDVELLLPLRRGLLGGTVLTHAEPGEDGFALLVLAPPLAEETPSLPRDLTLVVDVSGSMSGEKIDQAKTALRQALSTLRPRDRFRLIAFSNAVHQFREGFAAASPEILGEARRFVDGLAANGGTNLAGAIEAGLAERAGTDRLGIVVLLTDGLPTVGEQSPERIAADAASRIGAARIFTVGIGHDVNTYLLDRLAVDGRGSASYVTPGADVGDAMGTVLTRIARPALTDLRIVESPVRFLEQAPATLPDLFYGEELVVLARYRGEGAGPVILEGSRNGRRERFTLRASFGPGEPAHDYIAPLWAARRIGELTRQIRLEGASSDLVARVRELGLRYGIMTEYTSYLVREPGAVAEARPLPAGASMAREMTGNRAFAEAKSSAAMAASPSLQAADAAVLGRLDEVRNRDGGAASEARRAGGKLLVKRAGVWTDVAFRDGMKIKAVAPFSAAYFALVKARPALRRQLAAGHPLVLAGSRIALRVAEDGATEWGAGELDRFLRDYEGR